MVLPVEGVDQLVKKPYALLETRFIDSMGIIS